MKGTQVLFLAAVPTIVLVACALALKDFMPTTWALSIGTALWAILMLLLWPDATSEAEARKSGPPRRGVSRRR